MRRAKGCAVPVDMDAGTFQNACHEIFKLPDPKTSRMPIPKDDPVRSTLAIPNPATVGGDLWYVRKMVHSLD